MTEAEVEQRLRSQTSVMENLPDGWEFARIGDLVDITSGKYIKRSNYSRISDKPYPVAGAGGPIGWTDKTNFRAPIMTLGRVGAAGTLTVYQTDAWVTDNVLVIRPKLEEIFDILALFFQTIRWADIQTGSSQPLITQALVKQLEIPFPPLSEQKRIVKKVDELLARVNKVRGRLAKVQLILKRFRQAVLAAACSGRLTAGWRETNPTLESMKALLENVQKRRLQEANASSQKQKIDEIYFYQEKGDSESLPESWKYSALDKLCESFQYGTSRKSELSGKVPVLRMGNIQNGEIDWSDLVYTSHEEEVAKYRLGPGDVLFNRTNSPELVGKTAIYKGEHPAIFAGYLIRIRNLDGLDSSYLNFCLNTTYAKDYCMRVKTDGVSQSNINAQKLAKFEVPLCHPYEQQEIVRRVDALFNLTDAIEKRVALATSRADKLTQAILSKAFRGELVPTETELARREGRSYEPASELLARIKAESNLELCGKSMKRKRGARAD